MIAWTSNYLMYAFLTMVYDLDIEFRIPEVVRDTMYMLAKSFSSSSRAAACRNSLLLNMMDEET